MWNERSCRQKAMQPSDIPAHPEVIMPAWLTTALCAGGMLWEGLLMQDVTVLEADLTDAQHQSAVLHLVNAYARDPMGEGQDLPATVRDRLISGLQQHPTSLVFLAFAGATAVGVAVCFVGFSTFAARPLINIHDLAVIPESRGQGIGRLLLERIEAKARDLGCCKLTLEVRDDNRRAQQLYQNFGFGGMPSEPGSVRHWFLQKRL
jgi:ribosomal protein S18 acetylase RimI-like enzyme